MSNWMTEQRILLMGESDSLLHFLEENLDNEMYEIEVRDCEVEGVESIEKLHPNLILFDVEEEEQQQGWDFLNEVKKHDATADIPVLLCTDESQELREQERDFQILNIQLLYKPFNKEDLLDALIQPFFSAFDAANGRKRDMPMLQNAADLFSSLKQKFLSRWPASFMASVKPFFNQDILPDARLQEQNDRLEEEEQPKQENLLVQMDKAEVPLEEAEEQPEQVLRDALEVVDQLEGRQKSDVEEQPEQEKLQEHVDQPEAQQEKEDLLVPEEQTAGVLAIAK